jgi:hypothetical protein
MMKERAALDYIHWISNLHPRHALGNKLLRQESVPLAHLPWNNAEMQLQRMPFSAAFVRNCRYVRAWQQLQVRDASNVTTQTLPESAD